VLDWKFPGGRDAMLQDPDPLFANLDHVRRLINVMRSTMHPSGTGFEGMSAQHSNHPVLSLIIVLSI
jgi:hypothetical protein